MTTFAVQSRYLAPFDARVRRVDLAQVQCAAAIAAGGAAVGECDWLGQVIELGDDLHTMPPQVASGTPSSWHIRHNGPRTFSCGSLIRSPRSRGRCRLSTFTMLFIESTPWPMLTLIVSLGRSSSPPLS
jgi:hypothetical protein